MSLTNDISEKRNTRQALSIRMKSKANSLSTIETLQKNVISVDGKKFIDSEGGFLLEPTNKEQEDKILSEAFEGDWNPDPVKCIECEKEFLSSYLHTHFTYAVCDDCRDEKGKHSLITKSDARAEYLLKDCDFDLREPPLKFISRKNPHNNRYAEMKLYLLPQVERRAIEVWGSLEKLEEAHDSRVEKRTKAKAKKYNKNLKALRMAVRSSLFDRTSGPSHKHTFGPEEYNESEDTYSKKCTSCEFVETYEKM